MDWYAFTLSFKGVLLEGLEVAFIVLTFGATQGSIPLAAARRRGGGRARHGRRRRGARAARRVPENTMKFAVGVMLTTFGMFWAAEGAGAELARRSDAALPASSSSSSLVSLARRCSRRRRARAGAGRAPQHERAPPFGRFW